MRENDSKQQIRVEYDEGLANYFKDLKKYKPLKRDEERKLLIDYKENNDLVARQKLITSNLRYACSLVNKYRGQGVPDSDLIEEANCGLIESIDKFDISRDVKVITYAKWNIEYKMQEAIRQKGKIKESDFPEDTDKESVDIDDNYNSYDSDDIVSEYEYTNVYDEQCDSTQLPGKIVSELLVVLNDKEKDFVSMYYGIEPYEKEYTYQEIGDKYSITKERVRQIIEKSMRKLRVQLLTLT